MPHVIYGTHQVANQQLRETLEAIATALARSIRVTSGDRTTVPHGGALHSLHLMNDAVDFHVVGLSDAQAFELLRHDRRQIFGNATGNDFRYQIIRHGPHTHTQGPHIHLGTLRRVTSGTAVGIWSKGSTQISHIR